MRIDLFGGWSVEHDGASVTIVGDRQRGLLFRLALDPGTVVGYRALAEDLWPGDQPENPKASLQSLVARLRPQLPHGLLESSPGGYRLGVARDDVDAIRFQDAVAAASAAPAEQAAGLASAALALWVGEPWTPGDGYDWFERALRDDRATARALGGSAGVLASAESEIPAPLTALIGRVEELGAVADAVRRSRLTTILGPGGSGKTRLAVEVARRTPGALLVELAPATVDELWAALLSSLGREVRSVESQPASQTTPRDRAVAALTGRDALLVLDNCEHVVEAAAALARDLLIALPRLRVLATSREPLGVEGEAFVPLGPLAEVDAEQLFADRVLAARGVPLSAEEHDASARVRARLDGLPLALELAAARTRTLTLDELDAGLDDRFATLATGPRTAMPRHQTLRALIDWSWELLDEAERRMLAVVAIYPAGIAVADAAATARAHGGAFAQLDALVDKSLLVRGAGRYRALETIREYGIERLNQWGTLDAERRIQLTRLADAAIERDSVIRGAGVLDAIAWFDADDDNVAAALRYGVDHGLADDTVRLAAATAWYWVIRDRNDDAMTWLAAVGPMASGGTSDEALLVHGVAVLSQVFGGVAERAPDDEPRGARSPQPPQLDDKALAALHELVAQARGRRHDLLQVIPVLMVAFEKAIHEGSWPVAIEIPAPEGAGLDDWPLGMITAMRAAMAHNRGALAELGEASELALELFQRNGDLWGLALSMQMRAEWLILDGQLDEALRFNDESTVMMRRITSAWDLQQQQGASIGILVRLGRVEEAIERAHQQLAEAHTTGSSRALVMAEAGTASLYLALNDADSARPHLDALELAIREWREVPLQLLSMADLARGAYARLRGDLEAAGSFIRSAADAAVASGDHPIMAAAALGVGMLALERGEQGDARRALDLAVSLRGAPDPRDPTEAHLRSALGLTASSPAVAQAGLERDAAVAALTQILRR